ncbi:T-cell-specific surface glycoprotein CD28 [Eublepharis macularius]|uniref:T-cell-specific surface glycoprotein CD28 n=1 Tax=Eublepharis macularius TaxID=481883 RepID=A0AA97IZ98_EUBMA|nr:T-cell-specific surface glycoprotein CD28 [Eublepharis macularius]
MILRILTALSIIQLAHQTEKVISVSQPPLLVAENKNASIFCSYVCKSPETRTFKASMLKGTARAVEVCSVSWNGNASTHNDNKSGIKCRIEVNTTGVMFNLYNLSVNQTDIYVCKIEAVYPAPYHHGESNGTVLHVKEEPQKPPQAPEHSNAMVAAVAVATGYSVVATVAAVLIYCRLRNKKMRLPRNDYHNMISWQANSPKKRNSQPSAPARTYTTYRFWEP